MSDGDEKPYDIVVFGATGYTGKYVVEELAKISAKHNLKWAVAGRSVSKLKACLLEVQGFVENDDFVQKVGILAADVGNKDSLFDMCEKTKLVINCVGPYAFYGEAVIQACIAKGTHHIDISGEASYLEETQAKYFHDARDRGIYIVQSCGYDSIPADLGTAVLKKEFNGTLESVKIFTKILSGPQGNVFNSGTWNSAIHGISEIFQMQRIRQNLKEKLFTKKMPSFETGHGLRMPLSYQGKEKKWCLPLFAPDVPVIQRTQMFGVQFFDEVPVRKIGVFFSISSFIRALGVLFMLSIIGPLAFFSFGRYLLEKYPSFFSAGYFSNRGPTREQLKGTSVSVTLCGSGHSDDSEKSGEADETAPLLHSSGGVKTLGLKITGPDPAYSLTSICMVNSALVILEEANKMPLEGGILTPGAAFVNTTLVSRLKERGIKFEWIQH